MPSPYRRDQVSAAMRQRYGLDKPRRLRWVGIVAVVAAFAFAVGVVTVAMIPSGGSARIVSWVAEGEDHTVVSYQVDPDPEQTMTCVLRAQDYDHVDVGYAVVEIPPGTERSVESYPLATLAAAHIVELLGCATGGPPRVPGPQFPPAVVPPSQPYTGA